MLMALEYRDCIALTLVIAHLHGRPCNRYSSALRKRGHERVGQADGEKGGRDRGSTMHTCQGVCERNDGARDKTAITCWVSIALCIHEFTRTHASMHHLASSASRTPSPMCVARPLSVSCIVIGQVCAKVSRVTPIPITNIGGNRTCAILSYPKDES